MPLLAVRSPITIHIPTRCNPRGRPLTPARRAGVCRVNRCGSCRTRLTSLALDTRGSSLCESLVPAADAVATVATEGDLHEMVSCKLLIAFEMQRPRPTIKTRAAAVHGAHLTH